MNFTCLGLWPPLQVVSSTKIRWPLATFGLWLSSLRCLFRDVDLQANSDLQSRIISSFNPNIELGVHRIEDKCLILETD